MKILLSLTLGLLMFFIVLISCEYICQRIERRGEKKLKELK